MLSKKELFDLVEKTKLLYDDVYLAEATVISQSMIQEDGSIKDEAFLCFDTVIDGVEKTSKVLLETMQKDGRNFYFDVIDGQNYSVRNHYFLVEGKHYLIECISKLQGNVFATSHDDEVTFRLNEYNQRMYKDALTGVYNRYYYNEKCVDNQDIFAIAMIDINNFKNVNDTYGHLAGDEALKAVATCLAQGIRSTDALIRYGGDEFVILYPKLPVETLEKRLDSLAENVKKIVLSSYHTIHLSISIGAVFDVVDVEKNLKQADRLMYLCKSRRNNVCMAKADEEDELIHFEYKRDELNRSGLDDRIFDAFSDTADNQFIYLCNMRTGVSRWSKKAIDVFGLPSEYMLNAGEIWAEHLHPDDRNVYLNDIREIFDGKKDRHHLEYRAKNAQGNYVVCTCDGVILKGSYGEADLFAGMIYSHGIIDNVDPVTSLYNEYEFLQILSQLYHDQISSLIMSIGINNFSNINLVYDYSQGNKILKEFAKKISELMSGLGMVYRLDGAKFGIQVRDGNVQTAIDVYDKIQQIASKEIYIEDTHFALSISGGALLLDKYQGNARSIRSSVVYAQQISKRSRNGDLVFFDSELGNASVSSMEILQLARNDVINNCRGFYMNYQPVINATTKKVAGVEALIRWNNDSLGVVSPGQFIPMIENDPCMKTLGQWILRQTLIDMKPIVEKQPNFMVNVNVAFTQLDDNGGFREQVLDILEEVGFPAKNLCLELTERCQWIGLNKLNELIRFFRGRNISVAIDDFGTGYSSVALLKNLDVNEVKIDQSFSKNICTNDKDRAIVEMIVGITNSFNIKICVEGVENQETVDILDRLGPHFYQGYHFSKPLDLKKLVEYLEG